MELNRTKKIPLVLFSFCLFYSTISVYTQNIPLSWYCWKTEYKPLTALQNCVKTPNEYEKIAVSENSFSQWLRFFPIKSIGGKVLLYNGKEKVNQSAQYAILDIDVGTKDLQQCADAVMRLRAEYLYSQKKYNEIKFNFTNGFECAYSKWIQGYRPKITGNKASWHLSAQPGNTYLIFKQYLNMVFNYAGTASLEKELKSQALQNIVPGNVFIKGGHPGHAVIVMDVATNRQNEKIFLLAQSYMPAQEIHILKNPTNTKLSPWYSISEITTIVNTPEWTFYSNQLKKF
ncbi:MAG: DUF4846 domain-containing protein [Flavobacteriales bacterium]|nr:DUF4846 domain-containing protein [Flavobacteriales bacterium]